MVDELKVIRLAWEESELVEWGAEWKEEGRNTTRYLLGSAERRKIFIREKSAKHE